jgi:putative ABC transport system permease protein
MRPRRAIFLAWRNLTRDLGRLAWFCAGVGFAVVLMFAQNGCRNALLDSSVLLLRHLRGELFVVSRQQTTIVLRTTFHRDLLPQALAFREVESAYPVYIEYSKSLLRNTAREVEKREQAQTIRVIGVDPDAYLLDFPVLNPASPQSCVPEMRLLGRALFDRRSKANWSGATVYGRVGVGTETDLAGQRIVVVGEFDLGSDFGTDGTLVVNTETFRHCLRSGPPIVGLEQVDIGLVRLAPGADPEAVRPRLQEYLGDEVQVLTKRGLMAREQAFWKQNTPIGAVFGFGMVMGLAIGVVICFQILSTDIRDNQAAYATLRAIGYPRKFLVRIVVEEALLLAVMGFVPGMLVSALLYVALAAITDLPLDMTAPQVGFIFALTVGMCAVSGVLAAFNALKADPAEVY